MWDSVHLGNLTVIVSLAPTHYQCFLCDVLKQGRAFHEALPVFSIYMFFVEKWWWWLQSSEIYGLVVASGTSILLSKFTLYFGVPIIVHCRVL
jgi:hypothetical protein